MEGNADRPTPDPRRVFVVHGRNLAARDGMFAFLQAIRLDPIEWSQAMVMTGEASPYIGRILDVAFAAARAIVVLLTPDDITYLRSEYADGTDDPETKPAPQARPNVLFEAGMAMGRDAARTVVVELGHVRPFSDIAGRHVLRLDGSIPARKELAQRLATAGCEVDASGSHWLTAGDLTPPPPPGGGASLGKRLPEPTRSAGVKLDLQYHNLGSGNGRLEIINRGQEPVFKVALEFPVDAAMRVYSHELPLPELPPGKSIKLIATSLMGHGKEHFKVRVTGETAEGKPIADDIFLSIL